MSLHSQEAFIVERFQKLETDLDKKVRKHYDVATDAIVLILMKVFKQYESLPDSVRYILIKQELERLKVFQQIKDFYGKQGSEFVDFMKGVLDTNYEKAVEHTNQMLDNEEIIKPDYTIPASVEGWLGEVIKQGVEMVGLILALLSKGEKVEAIVLQVTELSQGQAYKAKRLARTETGNVLNDTAKAIYKESGVKKVKWTDATESLLFRGKNGKKHSTRVCKFCRKYATGGENGKGIYPIDKLPSPCPAHPNCRCTLIPIK